MNVSEVAPVSVPVLPEGASYPTRLITGLRALMILKDDAGNPQAGALVNRCFDYEVYRAHVARIRETPQGQRLLAERPSLRAADLDIDQLGRLPEGTLGRGLAEYFRANGFPPFDTVQPMQSDLDYISKRYRETHDLYHVVTGYSTDDLGEMELQAFVIGNLGIRSGRVITTFGYVPVALRQHRMLPGAYIKLLRAAARRGAAARPFLEFPFEDHWSSTVEQVRELLGCPLR